MVSAIKGIDKRSACGFFLLAVCVGYEIFLSSGSTRLYVLL